MKRQGARARTVHSGKTTSPTRNSTGSSCISLPAPSYGIDFVERGIADGQPAPLALRPAVDPAALRIAGPEKCGCDEGEKQSVGRCGCGTCGPESRPSYGTTHILEEDGSAREAPRAGLDDPQPYNGGSATIVCDGNGGYGVDLGGWAGAPCGIEGCVTRHEQSHARDWAGRWPNGCKNAEGTNKSKGSQIPLGGPGYAAFLRQSECDAYTVEEGCIAPLLTAATGGCKTRLRAHQTDTQNQKASFCS